VNLLGLDTSTAASAACVLRDDGEAFETPPDAAALGAPPAHAAQLLPAVAEVLGRAGVGWDDLGAIAVGVGPGTFTGLRIGIATARALARATGVGLRPVSSLAALAAGIEPEAGGGSVLALIDARRGELFAALYEEGAPTWPPFTASPDGVADRVRNAGIAPLAVGDGSVRFRGVLEEAGIRVAPDLDPAHVVRALHVCRLAANAPDQAPDTVLPEYLRQPDAKPAQ
jgi:tRNA threonylcarbamoyladenosine biosynthesis protein TsaB